MRLIGKLALEDGCIFTGTAFGAAGTRTGEVVFNTAMTGYQEVFTDPSYCGQIVTMTFPLQGNYGVNPADFESAKSHLSGVVLKELPRRPSNHRATASLPDFLSEQNIIGLADVDTRALTRRIRIYGALRGVLSTEIHDDLELVRMACAAPPMTGANLVDQVAPHEVGHWSQRLCLSARDGDVGSTSAGPTFPARPHTEADSHPVDPGKGFPEVGVRDGILAPAAPPAAPPRCHIVAIDCGIKHNILRHLAEYGCRVTTVPAGASAAQIRELAPNGLLVGNGPGDPAAVSGTTETLRALLGTLPIFGICLGHQLLALALGAKTYKLGFGHHGANLPVLNQPAGRIEITSQNHGFAVDAESLIRVGGTVTHVNLNDGSLEGFVHRDKALVAVQFHPEASPGPHDAGYMFQRFVDAVAARKGIDVGVLA